MIKGENPEIGLSIPTGTITTNCHDLGSGPPILFLHGSGPGVSAWANWRLSLAQLAGQFRCIAPDLVGFGYTAVPIGLTFDRKIWIDQIVALIDALGIEQVSIVGNSFGGALALALAARHPQRLAKLVLMGSVGVRFPITDGLDLVWGYTPSLDNMRAVMNVFAYNKSLISDDLIQMRLEASSRPDVAAAYEAMFPAPRQRWVDALALEDTELQAIEHKTLIVHGRDDQVIPLSNAISLNQKISRSELHVFGQCGHWTQIEHAETFAELLKLFLR